MKSILLSLFSLSSLTSCFISPVSVVSLTKYNFSGQCKMQTFTESGAYSKSKFGNSQSRPRLPAHISHSSKSMKNIYIFEYKANIIFHVVSRRTMMNEREERRVLKRHRSFEPSRERYGGTVASTNMRRRREGVKIEIIQK